MRRWLGEVGREVGQGLGGGVVELTQGPGGAPGARAVEEDQGQGDGELGGVSWGRAPDVHDVAQGAQRHRRVHGGLVLQEQAQREVAADPPRDAEPQIAQADLERLPHDLGGHGLEAVEVELAQHLGVEEIPQQVEQLGGVAEQALEEGVVWVAHGPRALARRWAQK